MQPRVIEFSDSTLQLEGVARLRSVYLYDAGTVTLRCGTPCYLLHFLYDDLMLSEPSLMHEDNLKRITDTLRTYRDAVPREYYACEDINAAPSHDVLELCGLNRSDLYAFNLEDWIPFLKEERPV